MKRTIRPGKTVAVLLAIALMLSMLPLSMISASAATKYLEGALSITIPDLKVGETPWTDIKNPTNISEGIYVSDIYWIDKGTNGKDYKKISNDSVLEVGHIYACHITVKTLDGYLIKDTEYRDDYNNRRWTNSTSIYVNGHNQESENNGEDIYPVKDAYGDEATVVFPAIVDKVLGVSVELDDPFANARPDYTAVIDSNDADKYSLYTPTDVSNYNNGVLWWDDTSKSAVAFEDTFAEGHNYKVYICLKASDCYEFDGIGSIKLPISYIGVRSCTVTRYNGSDKGDIIFISCDYGKCTKPQVKKIEIRGLNKPLPDCAPDFYIGYYGDEGYLPISDSTYKDGLWWYDKTENRTLTDDDVFKLGHEYACYIAVKAKDGFEFDTSDDRSTSYVSVTVNGETRTPGAFLPSPLTDCLQIGINYGKCEYSIITEVGIKDLDTTPRPGCTPDYDVTVEGSAYNYGYSYRVNTEISGDHARNGVEWGDHTLDGARLDPDNDTFIENHYYRVFINITPQPGYLFATDEKGNIKVTAKVNGEKALIGMYSITEENKTQCAYVYLYTDQCKTEIIGSVSVSGIEEPVAGFNPSFKALPDESDKYHIFTNFATKTANTYAIDGVSWYDRDAGKYLAPNDKFISGHSYTCTVYLLPNTGFLFPTDTDPSGVLDIPGKLNGRAGTVRNNIGRLMSTGGVLVTYTFDKNESPKLYSFSADDIVYPRPGKNPSYTATAGKFTKLCTDYHSTDMFGFHNGIMWYDNTDKRRMDPADKFIEGHNYSCQIVLEATNGCEFNFTDENTSKLEGTVGGVSAYGLPITSIEEERRLYLNASATIGTCEMYSGPVQQVTKIDIAGITLPTAGNEAQFYAESHTEGVYIDKSFDDEKFHNGVCWIDMTEYHPLELGEEFVDEHYYQLNVIVSAEDGYEFAESGGKSQVFTYINGEHESSMHFGDNDSKRTRQAYASYKCLPQEPVYNITVKGGSASLGGNTVFWSKYGEVLTLACSNTISYKFDHWECNDDLIDITDIYSPVTTFTMPDCDVTITAVTKEVEQYNITVVGGVALDSDHNEITSSESLRTVHILWNAPQYKTFVCWEADSNSIEIEDINSSETTFIMPKHDVTITAIEISEDEPEDKFHITVIGGKAFDEDDGEISEAKQGDKIAISWEAQEGKQFNYWTCENNSVVFDDPFRKDTTFIMPAVPVTITALYSDKDSGEDKCTVTFDSNGGSPDYYTFDCDADTDITLPECMFSAPKGMIFDGWTEGKPGQKYHVTGDITIFAEWTDIPPEILGSASCTIKVPAAGDNPAFTAKSTDTTKYSVAVLEWYLDKDPEYPDLTASDSFQGGKTYCVRIEFIPNEGYDFAETSSFSINGKETYLVGDYIAETKFNVADASTISGIYGDVDKDGSITANDALMILRESVGLENFDSELIYIGDVDQDGSITANDALAVLRYSVGYTGGSDLTGQTIAAG